MKFIQFTLKIALLLVVFSSCSVVKKNGYYQTRNYSFGKNAINEKSDKQKKHVSEKSGIARFSDLPKPEAKKAIDIDLELSEFKPIGHVNTLDLPTEVPEILHTTVHTKSYSNPITKVHASNADALQNEPRSELRKSMNGVFRNIGIYVLSSGFTVFAWLFWWSALPAIIGGILALIFAALFIRSTEDAKAILDTKNTSKTKKLGRLLNTAKIALIILSILLLGLFMPSLEAILLSAFFSGILAITGIVLIIAIAIKWYNLKKDKDLDL